MANRLMLAAALGALAVSGAAVTGQPGPAEAAASAVRLPVVLPERINLAGSGHVPVAVLGSAALDVGQLDPARLRLGGPSGGGAPVARTAAGPLGSIGDTNGDGRDDLVLFFDKAELRAAGSLSAGTAELALAGPLRDGRPARGADRVAFEVVLEVKFAEPLRVRGENSGLRSATGRDLAPVRALLDRYRARQVTPLVPGETVDRLAALATRARERTGRPAPDLASWYHLTLPSEVDAATVLAQLRARPEVADAYPAPEPAPPPGAVSGRATPTGPAGGAAPDGAAPDGAAPDSAAPDSAAPSDVRPAATPDFRSMQGYLRPAPQGIDADFASRDPRARGAGIRVVDLEYDWNPFHEDLQLDWSSDLGGTRYPRYTGFADEHGTAVFGEIVARDNAYGVTGGAPAATMYGISPVQQVNPNQTSYRPAAAMAYAAQFLSPGDVFLIEQQTVGPNGGTRYVPIEWNQANFDATQLLTQLGIVVVATGGNGGDNLDGPEFLGRFDRTVRDSGAIVVGAGSSTARERLNFSVYGSRLDLQGWGQNITTTGSNGNLQGGTDPASRNIRYTRSFGGTSGAGPIVTAAVAAIQSYLKATGRGVWTGDQLVELLRATGTPQGSGTAGQRIGPLPNLRAALARIEAGTPATAAPAGR
ncbi:S8 family serine peptidase [Micromonospora sp. NPDC049559]|uniref:S8 family serine peptidase n=1 Tax=Micromonospora sp. NPDC049559 TaxID=3155923 RepID=UPI003448BECB